MTFSSSASVSSPYWIHDSSCRGISSQRSSMYLHLLRPFSPIRPQSQVPGVRRCSYLFFFFFFFCRGHHLTHYSWVAGIKPGSPALERSLVTIMLLPLSRADFSQVSRKCLLSPSELFTDHRRSEGLIFLGWYPVLVLEEQHVKSRLSDARPDWGEEKQHIGFLLKEDWSQLRKR